MGKNLFAKLMDRRNVKKSTLNSTVKKRIGALAIATTLGLSTLSLSSCDLLNQFINLNNNTNNSGTINSGDSSNSGSTNSKYSKLLQNILNDNNLDTPYHPYAFLDREGYDIEAIKAENITCETMSYVKDNEPNNLYMMTYVETKSTTPYYTEYLIKYNLTDKEMSDYKMLHNDSYSQAKYMNNEISENKFANVISKAKITVAAHNNFNKQLYKLKSNIGADTLNVMLRDYDVDSNTFSLYISPRRASYGMVVDGKIGIHHMRGSNSQVEANNGVMYSPVGNYGTTFRPDYAYSFNDSLEDITLYNNQHAYTHLKDLSTDI